MLNLLWTMETVLQVATGLPWILTWIVSWLYLPVGRHQNQFSSTTNIHNQHPQPTLANICSLSLLEDLRTWLFGGFLFGPYYRPYKNNFVSIPVGIRKTVSPPNSCWNWWIVFCWPIICFLLLLEDPPVGGVGNKSPLAWFLELAFLFLNRLGSPLAWLIHCLAHTWLLASHHLLGIVHIESHHGSSSAGGSLSTVAKLVILCCWSSLD